MPRYSENDPLINTKIRQAVAGAIYVEIAITAGMKWEGVDISKPDEEKRKQNPDQKREGDYSGKFKRIRDDGNVPALSSCKYIQKSLKGGNIVKWRSHPIWPLLCNHLTNAEYINKALKTIESRVRLSIWDIPYDLGDKKFSPRSEISPVAIKDVSEFRNFDALLTLTAWAKESRNGNILKSSWQCAEHLYNIFPQAICNTPHLFIRWPLLIEIYNESIWSQLESEVSYKWVKVDLSLLAQEIKKEEILARKRGIKLPPPHIVSSINKNHYLFH